MIKVTDHSGATVYLAKSNIAVVKSYMNGSEIKFIHDLKGDYSFGLYCNETPDEIMEMMNQ